MIRRADARNAVVLSAGPTDAVARINTIPAVQPGVKPLVWEAHDDSLWLAETILGEYRVRFDDGWWAELTERLIYWGWAPENDPRSYSGPSAAMAAAQADYEARILAALTPQPAPDVAGLVEAARRSAEGWTNAIELGIIPPHHRTSAGILRDELNAALAALEGRG
jgi:hypothetical protein